MKWRNQVAFLLAVAVTLSLALCTISEANRVRIIVPTVNLHLKQCPLRTALLNIGEQTGMEMVISEDVDKIVDVNLTNTPLEKALEQLVTANGYYWRRDGNSCHVSSKPIEEPTRLNYSIPIENPLTESDLESEEPRWLTPEIAIPPPPISVGETRGVDKSAQRTEVMPLRHLDCVFAAKYFGWEGIPPQDLRPVEPSPADQAVPVRERLPRVGETPLLTEPGYGGPLAGGYGTGGEAHQYGYGYPYGGYGGGYGIGGYGGYGIGGYGRYGGYGGYGVGGYGIGGYGGYGIGGYGIGGYGIGGYGYGAYPGGAAALPPDMLPPVPFTPQNALLVTGTPEAIDEFRELVRELDVPTPQVMIEAKFVDVSTDFVEQWGVDWYLAAGTMYAEATGLSPGGPVEIGYAEGNFKAVLTAMLQEGWGKVVNSPRVACFSAPIVPPLLSIGTQFPVWITTTTVDAFGNVITSYNVYYIPVQTSLTAYPIVLADGTIRCTFNWTITDSPRTVIEPITGASWPIISTQTISTELRFEDGQTIVVGGLVTRREEEGGLSVPILRDLPLIGEFFRTHRHIANDSELLIFITVSTIHLARESVI